MIAKEHRNFENLRTAFIIKWQNDFSQIVNGRNLKIKNIIVSNIFYKIRMKLN